jgi:hypothetical protein
MGVQVASEAVDLLAVELELAGESEEDEDDDAEDELDDSEDVVAGSLAPEGPLADEVDERESVIYQPLPLKTMPTGWMTLRNEPPHCSHVVSGGSEKLWRFSITSLQAVQV